MSRTWTAGVAAVLATTGLVAALGSAPNAQGAVSKTCAGKKATILDPSKGRDRIVGTRGRDVIVAGWGRGRDVVLGLDGNDLICGDARTRVFGGRGDDTVIGAGRAEGGKGSDVFRGVGEARGGKGRDTAWVPIGQSSFDGGTGWDLVVFYEGYVAGLTDGVYVNLALGQASSENSVGSQRSRTSLAGVEEVRGTPDNDLILGDGFDNVLRGGAGNDVLTGRGGNDTVIGGLGKDVCSGEIKKGC